MAKLTRQQQKALHLGYKHLAEVLNDSGYDMKAVLKEDVLIPWTPSSVKEYLWRPIQKAMVQKKSTTELEKVGEIELIWDTLMRHLGEKFGIEYVHFPHDSEKQKAELGGYKSAAGQGVQGVDYPTEDRNMLADKF